MENHVSYNHMTGNFGQQSFQKPNSGLSLENLANIPREIRNKLNLNLPASKAGTFYSQNLSSTLKSNPNLKSTDFSKMKEMKDLTHSYSLKSQDGVFKQLKNSSKDWKNSTSHRNVTSPTSNLFKANRCHRYHTDLDFNYLTNEKFYKDAVSCGKERLTTKALKSSSPDKYYYENKQIKRADNRYTKQYNNTSVNVNTYLTGDEPIILMGSHGEISGQEISKSRSRSKSTKSNDDKNIKKSSKGILSDLLDKDFSVTSPSKLKIFQNEIDMLRREEQKHNILNIKKSLDQSKFDRSNRNNEENKIDNLNNINNHTGSINKSMNNYINNIQMTEKSLSSNFEEPNQRYLDCLETIMTYFDPIFEQLSFQERVEKFIECLDEPKRSVRLGAVVALYIMLRKFEMEESLKIIILEKSIYLLQNYETQEELFLVALLEISSLFAPCDILLQNISLFCMFLTDFNFPRLQKAAFNLLMSMEYDGIKSLIDLASKDYQEYQRFILTSMLSTPHIQKIIIIRALLNEVYSNLPDRRHSALAALNRLHDLVGNKETLLKLSKFFNEQKCEKIFLSSTIRTSGWEGEKMLLNELKTNKDFSVRVAICSVLSYRTPKNPKYLKILLDQNDTYSICKNLPGSFCTYYGKVSPCVHENDDDKEFTMNVNVNEATYEQTEDQEEYLEVNTRDFLAALQRMLIMNYDHSNPQLVHEGHHNLLENLNFGKNDSELISKYRNYFELNSLQDENPGDNNENIHNDRNGRLLISDEVIKTLCICLKDYSTAVRDTAASTLGQIGLPESLLAVDHLIEAIKDQDVNVKSKVIWALGRLSSGVDNAITHHIVDALKCNMWKVKSACLFTLSQFGPRSARLALPVLNKLLKESAINKQTIAETMIKLGSEGESSLLKIMSTENDSNYKLKSSIARAFALTNISSPNIDFIVECLFKTAKANNPLIRKNALFAIRILADKSEETVTYLKRKNVIPFYYEMMLDKENSIQAVRKYLKYLKYLKHSMPFLASVHLVLKAN